MDTIRQKLKEALEAKGISLATASRKLGKNQAYLQQFIERGVPRRLPEDIRPMLSSISGLTVGELGAILNSSPPPVSPGQMPVKGEVRAGVWIEENGSMDLDFGTVPIGPHPDFAGAEQFALKVVGSSMNRVVQSGQYVIVVSWPHLGRNPKDGDLLVVRREREGSFEVTLKRARFLGGQWELWPESDDPRYQTPIEWRGREEDINVRILGLVIGLYQHLV